MQKIFIILLSFSVFFNAYCQRYQWTQNLPGNIKQIVADEERNIYVLGTEFWGTVDLDVGPTDHLVTTNSFDGGSYIAKYDSIFNLIWAISSDSITFPTEKAIYLNDDGEVYISGSISGSFDFDLQQGTFPLTGNGNIFIAKYKNEGELMWARHITDKESSAAISGDSESIYLAGGFEGTVDVNPDISSTTTLISNGGVDIFVAKYDSLGNLQFGNSMGGIYDDFATKIKINSQGNIVISGAYNFGASSSDVDFDPGTGTETLNSFNANFLASYDNLGNFISVIGLGHNGFAGIFDYDFDSVGNTYVTGKFNNTIDFDPSANTASLTSLFSEDAFIAKYDANGNYKWAKQLASSNSDVGTGIQFAKGEIFLTGWSSGDIDLDPKEAEPFPGPDNKVIFPNKGMNDIFFSRYDTLGNILWGGAIAGADWESSYDVFIIDSAIYLSGAFNGTVDFDPDTIETADITVNDFEGFAAKYFISELSINNVVDTNDTTINTNLILLDAHPEIEIFPNPVNGSFIHIHPNRFKNDRLMVSVRDITGKEFFKKAYSYPYSEIKIETSHFPNGNYFVNVSDGQNFKNKKIVVNR